jgi:predicted RNA binding protein YcfA (HicA-like mRNA interferase family)
MSLRDLPLCDGLRHAKVLQRGFGWQVRSKGNHIILTNPNAAGVTLSIPNHKEVKRPLLHAQLVKARISDEDYRKKFDEI